MSAGHKVIFYSGQGLEHSEIRQKGSGAYRSKYWNYYTPATWYYQAAGAAPLVVARNANYYWSAW